VTLADRSSRPVGTIHIRASDGRVMRVEGMYSGRNMEHVEVNQDVDEPPPRDDVDHADNPPPEDQEVTGEDADENIVKRDIKRMFRRTTNDAKRMFMRVRRSFVDFFNR